MRLDLVPISVSTHSHPKVAAPASLASAFKANNVSTHSHPKVAAYAKRRYPCKDHVSTHSHPKVAASVKISSNPFSSCFNTQPPEGGCLIIIAYKLWVLYVSTHSHPKVAAMPTKSASVIFSGFNTQPPEGGCLTLSFCHFKSSSFNTQPPEGGCVCNIHEPCNFLVSTHSHPKVAVKYPRF